MEVSIIIPVHNSEKYLKECIESAQNQSFHDIEILCIDGGSTDSSFEIIKALQKEDERIFYLQDSNTSYGHKINVGIRAARGKYIAILESDDKMCSDMIKETYNIAEIYGADIVDVDFYELFSHRGRDYRTAVKKYSPCSYGYLIQKSELMRKYKNENNRKLNDQVIQDSIIKGIWTALYRKDFIIENGIWLNESKGASYQDFSFVFLTSLLSGSVYHLMTPLYLYRKDNIGSSVRDDSKIMEIIGECDFLKCDLEKRNVNSEDIWKLFYIKKYEAFYWNYCRLSSQARIIFLEQYMKELTSDIKIGNMKREMTDINIYHYTFQLLDDQKGFVEMVKERDGHLSIEKICKVLDKTEKKDIVIFGIGIWGSKILDMLMQSEVRILGICDNSRKMQNTEKRGFRVMDIDTAVKKFPNSFFLIANRNNSDEMIQQLYERGIKQEKILTFT